MRGAVRHSIVALAIAMLSAPIAVVVTLLLLPFWRWLEDATGIESVGHSGPADWCFTAVYGVCVVAAGTWYAARVVRQRQVRDSRREL